MLNELQKKIAEVLLLTIKDNETIITYKTLGERANTKKLPQYIGADLGEVSSLCHKMNLPLITAKVIRGEGVRPGTGFFKLVDLLGIDKQDSSEEALYHKEIKKILDCKEWQRLSDDLELNINMKPMKTTKSKN